MKLGFWTMKNIKEKKSVNDWFFTRLSEKNGN